MTSVWETILQLPILGTVAMTGPRSFAAKCAAIMHEREPEADRGGGTGRLAELVNIVGGKALVPYG
jgi:hypothetical protein